MRNSRSRLGPQAVSLILSALSIFLILTDLGCSSLENIQEVSPRGSPPKGGVKDDSGQGDGPQGFPQINGAEIPDGWGVLSPEMQGPLEGPEAAIGVFPHAPSPPTSELDGKANIEEEVGDGLFGYSEGGVSPPNDEEEAQYHPDSYLHLRELERRSNGVVEEGPDEGYAGSKDMKLKLRHDDVTCESIITSSITVYATKKAYVTLTLPAAEYYTVTVDKTVELGDATATVTKTVYSTLLPFEVLKSTTTIYLYSPAHHTAMVYIPPSYPPIEVDPNVYTETVYETVCSSSYYYSTETIELAPVYTTVFDIMTSTIGIVKTVTEIEFYTVTATPAEATTVTEVVNYVTTVIATVTSTNTVSIKCPERPPGS